MNEVVIEEKEVVEEKVFVKPRLQIHPAQSRLVVIRQIYFQPVGEQGVPIDRRYWRALKTNESPYLRNLTIGEEWKQLDRGWINVASHIEIENLEGHFTTAPSNEERGASALRIVEIAFIQPKDVGEKDPPRTMFSEQKVDHCIKPSMFIRPTHSQGWEPADLEQIYWRCAQGQARVKLHIFPV